MILLVTSYSSVEISQGLSQIRGRLSMLWHLTESCTDCIIILIGFFLLFQFKMTTFILFVLSSVPTLSVLHSFKPFLLYATSTFTL